jgi:hypothetical protein
VPLRAPGPSRRRGVAGRYRSVAGRSLCRIRAGLRVARRPSSWPHRRHGLGDRDGIRRRARARFQYGPGPLCPGCCAVSCSAVVTETETLAARDRVRGSAGSDGQHAIAAGAQDPSPPRNLILNSCRSRYYKVGPGHGRPGHGGPLRSRRTVIGLTEAHERPWTGTAARPA